MDKILLRTLWRAKYIIADSVEDITDKDIRKCVEEKSIVKEVILSTVDKAIKNVKMKMNLALVDIFLTFGPRVDRSVQNFAMGRGVDRLWTSCAVTRGDIRLP